MAGTMRDKNIVEAALVYAAQGLPVFPCLNKPEDPEEHKKPLTENGFYDASCDPKKTFLNVLSTRAGRSR